MTNTAYLEFQKHIDALDDRIRDIDTELFKKQAHLAEIIPAAETAKLTGKMDAFKKLQAEIVNIEMEILALADQKNFLCKRQGSPRDEKEFYAIISQDPAIKKAAEKAAAECEEIRNNLIKNYQDRMKELSAIKEKYLITVSAMGKAVLELSPITSRLNQCLLFSGKGTVWGFDGNIRDIDPDVRKIETAYKTGQVQ